MSASAAPVVSVGEDRPAGQRREPDRDSRDRSRSTVLTTPFRRTHPCRCRPAAPARASLRAANHPPPAVSQHRGHGLVASRKRTRTGTPTGTRSSSSRLSHTPRRSHRRRRRSHTSTHRRAHTRAPAGQINNFHTNAPSVLGPAALVLARRPVSRLQPVVDVAHVVPASTLVAAHCCDPQTMPLPSIASRSCC